MNKINTLSTPHQSFDYAPRQNAPQGSVGIMYEKKVKNPDGTVTTRLKNFSLNSAGFHTKALASGYSPLTKATATAYIQSKGISEENTNKVLEKITMHKYVSADTFERTINSMRDQETQSDLANIKKLTDEIS